MGKTYLNSIIKNNCNNYLTIIFLKKQKIKYSILQEDHMKKNVLIMSKNNNNNNLIFYFNIIIIIMIKKI